MAVLCRVCLRNDRLTYAMNNTVLQEVWEKLTSAKLNINNGKPLQVCYLCYAHLKKAYLLMQRALKAEVLLTVFINNGLQQTNNAISKISSLTPDFDYGYAVEYECEDIPREVPEIKKEYVETNQEEYYIDIKLETKDPCEEDNQDNVNVKLEVDARDEVPLKAIPKKLPERMVKVLVENTETDTLSSKHKLQSDNKTHTKVSTENKICEQNSLQSTSGIASNNSSNTSNDGNKLSIGNKEQEKNDMTCHICGYKGATKISIAKHLRKHAKDMPYQCDLCDYRSPYKYTLNSHIKSEHTTDTSLSCKLCKFKCMSEINFNKHLRKHKNDKPYECDLCPYKFSHKNSLVYHIKYKHTKDKKMTFQTEYCDEIKKYSCQICHYKCVTRSKLNVHIRTHTKEKPYMCYLCAYRFSHKNSLERHIQHKHTKEKNFSCHICQYKSVTKSNLTSHLRTHTEDKPYICSLCDYRCLQKANLTRHIQFKHSNERNYSCHICQYKFVTKGNLNKHLRKHAEEKLNTREKNKNLEENSD